MSKKLKTKSQMTETERKAFELKITKEFIGHRDDTKRELQLRLDGVGARAGGTGYQFAGYTTLERMYRGDQWDHDEPPGASQRTDNYCAVIVDNVSSLPFDDEPEVACPVDDPSDDLATIKAEAKENLIRRVYDDNDSKVEFDEWAKVSSLYGDGFLLGPMMERVDEDGDPIDPESKEGSWKMRFFHVENPGSIMPIFADTQFKRLLGFINIQRMSQAKAEMLYGDQAKARGISIAASINTVNQPISGRKDPDTLVPQAAVSIYWTANLCATFIQDKLLEYWIHNWGFVPMEHVKNIHTPNHPYGKSDIEDILDPQLSHNRTNNDLANLLRWVSTVNFWGKNLEGMQALVAGLSRIYSLPEDGELHTFEKPGDPYITNTYAQSRRSAIIDISGISEAMLSSSQTAAASGRALALTFQGTIRKLNPRMKRFGVALEHINKNVLKLYEKYYPKTKIIIGGDYRTKVHLPATILRNIVDTINKLQSGVISLDTAQKEAGVQQVRLEQKLMKKNLSDPVIGPQIARQPSLLPRLNEGVNQPGETPNPAPGNPAAASPAGAVAANNQQAGGAAPVPVRK